TTRRGQDENRPNSAQAADIVAFMRKLDPRGNYQEGIGSSAVTAPEAWTGFIPRDGGGPRGGFRDFWPSQFRFDAAPAHGAAVDSFLHRAEEHHVHQLAVIEALQKHWDEKGALFFAFRACGEAVVDERT